MNVSAYPQFGKFGNAHSATLKTSAGRPIPIELSRSIFYTAFTRATRTRSLSCACRDGPTPVRILLANTVKSSTVKIVLHDQLKLPPPSTPLPLSRYRLIFTQSARAAGSAAPAQPRGVAIYPAALAAAVCLLLVRSETARIDHPWH